MECSHIKIFSGFYKSSMEMPTFNHKSSIWSSGWIGSDTKRYQCSRPSKSLWLRITISRLKNLNSSWNKIPKKESMWIASKILVITRPFNLFNMITPRGWRSIKLRVLKKRLNCWRKRWWRGKKCFRTKNSWDWETFMLFSGRKDQKYFVSFFRYSPASALKTTNEKQLHR